MLNKSSIRSIWQSLQNNTISAGIDIPEIIADSWLRSKKYGVDPYKPHNSMILSSKELQKRIERNRTMLDIASVAMKDLNDITGKLGFCITLTDNEGYILKRIGDQEDIDFTDYGNFVEGANWAEEVMGTNAVGLALILDQPLQVYAYQHYCFCAAMSSCSAAPIHGLDGQIIGVLDLTGVYKISSIHVLGMVIASARAIERTLELRNIYSQARMSDIHKKAIIESMIEGLIALDANGVITHINNRAKNYLELEDLDYVGKYIKDILPQGNDYFFDIISSGRKLYAENILLNTKNSKKKLLINSTPLNLENDKQNGTVVVLHEMQPINRMINRIVGAKAKISFENLVGESTAFKKVVEQAKMAAQTDSSVLLLGESGVGKDLFAQSIHNASIRKSGPFLAINCVAVPKELIYSELFGYDEGAFTGAKKKGNPGKFELADQGTIFLDEIGETPTDFQASLLRVLEEDSVIRLGGREFVPVNVRLISATNRDLQEEIKKGNFRQDLFFRLGVIIIKIPPLRERKDDILPIVDYFLDTISGRLGKKITNVHPEVLKALMNYDWPGNIRELRNVIERAINLARQQELTIDLLPSELLDNFAMEKSFIKLEKIQSSSTNLKHQTEEELINFYMQRFDNNKSKVAKTLGISRSSLYRKMERYQMKI